MRIKIVTILFSLFLLGELFAQSENREMADFQVLKVSNSIGVILTQGDENSLTITGVKPEDLDKVKTEIADGVLSVYTKGKIESKDNIKVLITFKHISSIEQSGASEISSTGTIREDKISIKGSGAIESELDLEVNQLTINLSGASDIKITGKVNDFDLKLSGASDLKAAGLLAKNVKVDISGASDVKVYASESISGKASGASSINVGGSPKIREINTGGASSYSYGNTDISSIKIGKQHLEISDDEVEVKLGNKQINVIDHGDTTRIKWGNSEFLVIDDSVFIKRKPKKRRSHWAGVDLSLNGFVNSSNSFDLSDERSTAPKEATQFMELNYSKSWTFGVNFAEWFIKIKDHHFGLVTGLGTEWNNYELKHNVKLNPEGGRFVHEEVDEYNRDYTWGEIDTVYNYSKNRFKTWFINAPLLLELNTGDHKNKSFHISAGAIVGFNLQTKMKYIYNDNGDEKKEKDKQDFNTNPFRVSMTVRAGVGWFNLFATYSLTPLFENNRGPELYPFTVGVTLVGF
jgi:hypothetical protein